MDQKYEKAWRYFKSLRECIEFIQERYPQRQVCSSTLQKVNGSWQVTLIPRYLYRGEKSCFPTTMSGLDRLQCNRGLEADARRDLEKVVKQCNEYFVTRLAGSRASLGSEYLREDLNTAGFLQHYGMPTEFIDFTSGLDVAAFFASEGKLGTNGLICVLPSDIFAVYPEQTPEGYIVDLGDMPIGQRASKQNAYGVVLRKIKDLKDNMFVQLGARWYEFTLTEADRGDFRVRTDLLDLDDDVLATQIAGAVHQYIHEFGKINDQAARWLAHTIVVMESVLIPDAELPNGRPVRKLASLRQLRESGYRGSDETDLRCRCYRKWSVKYPDEKPAGPLPPHMISINLVKTVIRTSR